MSYSESYFTTRESWRDWRIEASELIRAAHIRNGSRVLEIGCGGGGLLRMLRQRGTHIVGVDTLVGALKLAQNRLDAGPRTVRKGRCERGETRIKEKIDQSSIIHAGLVCVGKEGALPFDETSFDAIIGQHVIEHLPDAGASLCEWSRLLKPKGRLALATPNVHYPDPAHFADAEHAHIFSTPELRDVVEKAGFVVESCFTIFPFLTHARVLRTMGVIVYNVFRFVPFFSARGRTIMLAARKT